MRLGIDQGIQKLLLIIRHIGDSVLIFWKDDLFYPFIEEEFFDLKGHYSLFLALKNGFENGLELTEEEALAMYRLSVIVPLVLKTGKGIPFIFGEAMEKRNIPEGAIHLVVNQTLELTMELLIPQLEGSDAFEKLRKLGKQLQVEVEQRISKGSDENLSGIA